MTPVIEVPTGLSDGDLARVRGLAGAVLDQAQDVAPGAFRNWLLDAADKLLDVSSGTRDPAGRREHDSYRDWAASIRSGAIGWNPSGTVGGE